MNHHVICKGKPRHMPQLKNEVPNILFMNNGKGASEAVPILLESGDYFYVPEGITFNEDYSISLWYYHPETPFGKKINLSVNSRRMFSYSFPKR